jgi:uncharacterized protein with PIN domain
VEKFIITRELGRLAKWLRILGFDTVYFKARNRSSLIIDALRENRIILTRNHHINAAPAIRLINIQADILSDQLKQLAKEAGVKFDKERLFSRCTICNAELVPIDKEKAKDKVPAYVFEEQDNFCACPACQKIYWAGTHWGNVEAVLKEIG